MISYNTAHPLGHFVLRYLFSIGENSGMALLTPLSIGLSGVTNAGRCIRASLTEELKSAARVNGFMCPVPVARLLGFKLLELEVSRKQYRPHMLHQLFHFQIKAQFVSELPELFKNWVPKKKRKNVRKTVNKK